MRQKDMTAGLMHQMDCLSRIDHALAGGQRTDACYAASQQSAQSRQQAAKMWVPQGEQQALQVVIMFIESICQKVNPACRTFSIKLKTVCHTNTLCLQCLPEALESGCRVVICQRSMPAFCSNDLLGKLLGYECAITEGTVAVKIDSPDAGIVHGRSRKGGEPPSGDSPVESGFLALSGEKGNQNKRDET
jgi:hypothetical protein